MEKEGFKESLKNSKELEKDFWGKLSKPTLIIAGLFLLFSFLAPWLLVQPNMGINFTETGPIGDTIGGIMNPFVSIAGVLLTFLAFYMQVQSNKLQFELFIESRKQDIDLKIAEQSIELKDNFEILMFDLEAFIDDVKKRKELIFKFSEYKDDEQLTINPVQRPSNVLLEHLFLNDRKQTYLYLKYTNPESNDWLKDYRELYFYTSNVSEYINDLYQRTDNFNDEILRFFEIIPNEFHQCYQKAIMLYNKNIKRENYDGILNSYDDFKIQYENHIPSTFDLKGNNHLKYTAKMCTELHAKLTLLNTDADLEIMEFVLKLNRISTDINMTIKKIKIFKEMIKNNASSSFEGENGIERKLNLILDKFNEYKNRN